MILDDDRRLRGQQPAKAVRLHREIQSVDVRDLDRSEVGGGELPRPTEVILDTVAPDDRVVMKPLVHHDAIGARLEKRLAPTGQRRVALQQLVGIGKRAVEVEVRL